MNPQDFRLRSGSKISSQEGFSKRETGILSVCLCNFHQGNSLIILYSAEFFSPGYHQPKLLIHQNSDKYLARPLFNKGRCILPSMKPCTWSLLEHRSYFSAVLSFLVRVLILESMAGSLCCSAMVRTRALPTMTPSAN